MNPHRGAVHERLVDQALAPATLAKLSRVRLRITQASGERPGQTRVRHQSDSYGTEFERHVPYSPGDELRHIDWITYARLGELLTRRFVAEREVPIAILIDTSPSMGPAGPGSKLDMAAALAAILSMVSLSHGDRLYLTAMPGDRGRSTRTAETLGPLRGRHGMHQVRQFLGNLKPSEHEIDLASSLKESLRTIRRGLVIVLSDFLIPAAEIAPALDVIRATKCEGKLAAVLSREDLDPSWLQGQGHLVDRETGQTCLIDPSKATWERYRAALDEHLGLIRANALRNEMSMVVTASDLGLDQLLREELPRLGLSLVR